MNKKIILAAVLLLSVTVLFAACKKDSGNAETTTSTTVATTDKDGFYDLEGGSSNGSVNIVEGTEDSISWDEIVENANKNQ